MKTFQELLTVIVLTLHAELAERGAPASVISHSEVKLNEKVGAKAGQLYIKLTLKKKKKGTNNVNV